MKVHESYSTLVAYQQFYVCPSMSQEVARLDIYSLIGHCSLYDHPRLHCTILTCFYCISRLKEQRDRSEKEHQDELDLYTKKAQDLKVNLDKLQKELTSKQTEVSTDFTTQRSLSNI